MDKFQSGQRVIVTHASEDTYVRIKNKVGTIHKRRPNDRRRWWVRIDGDKGFEYQEDCWSVLETDLQVLDMNNKQAVTLLDKEF